MPPKTATKAGASVAASTQVLLLTQKAEVKETKLNTAADGTITIAMLKALLKKKEAPEFIGSYKHKSHTLFLFGYLKGKSGTENKHELPPPHDTVTLFGDAILLASQSENDWTCPVLLKAADYEAFYTRAFGGFEDLDEEDNEDSEIEDEIEDAVEAAAAIEDEGEIGETDEVDEEGDEEEDDSEDENEDAEEDAEEGVAPISKKGRNSGGNGGVTETINGSKAKKVRRVAPAGGAGSSGAYGIQLYIPEGEELREEWPCPGIELPTLYIERKKVHRFLQSYFKDLLDLPEIDEFERCIYNSTIRKANEKHISKAWSHKPFVILYHTVSKMLASNFNPNSYVKNTELYQRYKDGLLTFADICGMDSYQLFEARWKDNFIQQQLQEKRQLEGNRALATDRFLCTRCWKRECTYYEMQTRSADEPMTIFITCVNCGKHWRQ